MCKAELIIISPKSGYHKFIYEDTILNANFQSKLL